MVGLFLDGAIGQVTVILASLLIRMRILGFNWMSSQWIRRILCGKSTGLALVRSFQYTVDISLGSWGALVLPWWQKLLFSRWTPIGLAWRLRRDPEGLGVGWFCFSTCQYIFMKRADIDLRYQIIHQILPCLAEFALLLSQLLWGRYWEIWLWG